MLLCVDKPQVWASSVATAITLAVTSGSDAVTTVTSGSAVTLTATVNAGTVAVTTGQVSFCDTTAAHCTDVHLLGTSQLTSAGTAHLTFIPGIGSHSYNAIFAGATNGGTHDAASTSSNVALTVTGRYPPTTTIAQSGSAGVYTLTAVVGGVGPFVPSGTISFLDTSNGNAVLGSATLASSNANLSLLNNSNPVTGTTPSSVAVGDFNGDGIPDLAVANYGAGTVTILLGNGNGTFTQALNTPTTVGGGPSSVAVADFNGDGIADLAVANSNDNTATILLGNGDGSFTQAANSPVPVGSGPISVAVGDFNGNAIPDLAVANAGSNTITILLGDGSGNFTQAANSPVTVGSEPSSVAVGDFDGNGVSDLAIANYGAGTLTILIGNGDGTFTQAANSPITTGVGSISVAVGDFNGDGIPDLAVANYGENTVTILLGSGNGTFAASATKPATGAAPSSVAVGDFNGDGTPDLAVTSEGSNTVTVLQTSLQTATATVTGISLPIYPPGCRELLGRQPGG